MYSSSLLLSSTLSALFPPFCPPSPSSGLIFVPLDPHPSFLPSLSDFSPFPTHLQRDLSTPAPLLLTALLWLPCAPGQGPGPSAWCLGVPFPLILPLGQFQGKRKDSYKLPRFQKCAGFSHHLGFTQAVALPGTPFPSSFAYLVIKCNLGASWSAGPSTALV